MQGVSNQSSCDAVTSIITREAEFLKDVTKLVLSVIPEGSPVHAQLANPGLLEIIRASTTLDELKAKTVCLSRMYQAVLNLEVSDTPKLGIMNLSLDTLIDDPDDPERICGCISDMVCHIKLDSTRAQVEMGMNLLRSLFEKPQVTESIKSHTLSLFLCHLVSMGHGNYVLEFLRTQEAAPCLNKPETLGYIEARFLSLTRVDPNPRGTAVTQWRAFHELCQSHY